MHKFHPMRLGNRELMLGWRRPRVSVPLRLTLWFLVLAFPWVALTDLLVLRFAHEPARIATLQTSKAWLFVGVTALFLFVASSRIFSRLRRTMALLDAVQDSVADGILVLDSDGVVVQANRAACRMLQTNRSELVGMDGPAFVRRFRVSREDGRLVPPEQLISQRARSGMIFPRYVAVLFRGDGSKLAIESSAAPVRDPETGEISLVVSVLRDVTHQRELTELRDDFLTAMAHEMRTPLTAIRLAVQRALRSPTNLTAALHHVDHAAQRMQRTIEELQEAVRVRVGELTVDLDWVDLVSVLRARTDDADHRAPRHALTIELDPPQPNGLWMWTDVHAVEQVITQLLDNAVKYSPAGGRVRVLVRSTPDRVEVSVSDEGLGIPAERQPFVFERYYRAQRETPYDYGGMGIGLYVAKAKVEALGGRIGFESTPGQGSRFWFTLPRFELPSAEHPERRPPERHPRQDQTPTVH